MAIHHIRDTDVAAAPFWPSIAASILRPDGGVLALAAHRAAFEQRFCTPRFAGETPWICTWKCALRLWPDLSSFSNQMLRYQRNPAGLVHERGLPAHRAYPDAYVTAHHLRDMLNAASLEQLLIWSQEPGLLPRVTQGPDRGKAWSMLADETLRTYAKDRDINIRFSAEKELGGRSNEHPAAKPQPAQRPLL
jgi:exodeoxyribonuclease X